jgi:hypothetical protein
VALTSIENDYQKTSIVEKLNSILQKVLTFLDKNATLAIVAALLFLAYKKFGNLFTDLSAKKEEQAAALASHDELLAGTAASVKKPLPADPKKRPAVARENVKVLDLKLQAQIAENLHNAYKPRLVLMSTRRAEAMTAAKQMQKFKVSLAGVAAQYKALTGDVLQSDMRTLFDSDYPKWLAIAGTVK